MKNISVAKEPLVYLIGVYVWEKNLQQSQAEQD
jgi:hypothetical protein